MWLVKLSGCLFFACCFSSSSSPPHAGATVQEAENKTRPGQMVKSMSGLKSSSPPIFWMPACSFGGDAGTSSIGTHGAGARATQVRLVREYAYCVLPFRIATRATRTQTPLTPTREQDAPEHRPDGRETGKGPKHRRFPGPNIPRPSMNKGPEQGNTAGRTCRCQDKTERLQLASAPYKLPRR